MKNARTLSLLALALVAALPVLADENPDAAIIDVIDRAYVQGIHLDADAEKVRSGMHDTFVMFVRTDTGVNQVTRDQWIARLKPRDAATPRPDIKARIEVLDRSGDAAVA